MDTATAPAEFKGWATVEIMGYNQVSGYVETLAFGAVVMFRVSVPVMAPVEEVTEKPLSIAYQRIPAGSKIRVSRDAFETLIGSGSVSRMTRVTEGEALARHGNKVEILERAEEPENGQCPECERDEEENF
jgi:hypothetical protein